MMGDGVHESFFYIHIRNGQLRFHFLDLHRSGVLNLYGGTFRDGPITSSGWHGQWIVHQDVLLDDSYTSAMTMHFHYAGDAAGFMRYHHTVALQSSFMQDCWVVFENSVPHAIMFNLLR